VYAGQGSGQLTCYGYRFDEGSAVRGVVGIVNVYRPHQRRLDAIGVGDVYGEAIACRAHGGDDFGIHFRNHQPGEAPRAVGLVKEQACLYRAETEAYECALFTHKGRAGCCGQPPLMRA
jgi:hypothetical protein